MFNYYTEALEKTFNYNVYDWIIKGLIHTDGLLYFIDRQEERLVPQILEKLKIQDEERKQECLKEINAEVPTMETDKELQESLLENRKLGFKTLKDAEARLKKFEEAKAQLNLIKEKAKNYNNKILNHLLEEAQNDLNVIEEDIKSSIDYGSQLLQETQNFEEYKKMFQKHYERELEWDKQKKEQAKQRLNGDYCNFAGAYEEFINVMDEIKKEERLNV